MELRVRQTWLIWMVLPGIVQCTACSTVNISPAREGFPASLGVLRRGKKAVSGKCPPDKASNAGGLSSCWKPPAWGLGGSEQAEEVSLNLDSPKPLCKLELQESQKGTIGTHHQSLVCLHVLKGWMHERIINWPQIRDWWKVGEKSVEKRSTIARSPGVEISTPVFITMFTMELWEPCCPWKSYMCSSRWLSFKHSWTHDLSASQGECQLPGSKSHLWFRAAVSHHPQMQNDRALPWDAASHQELPYSLLCPGGHVQMLDVPLSRADGPTPLGTPRKKIALIRDFLGNWYFIISPPVGKGKGLTVEIIEEW